MMKTKLLSIFTFIAIGLATNAQNVTIPDASFKAILIANTNINTNSDSEIQVSEASAYTGSINVANANIQDLTGMEAFTEIIGLQAFGNATLTSVDVSQNTKLTQLLLEQTGISGILDLSMLPDLVDFKAHTTALTAINMANGNNSNVTRFNVVSSAVTCVQIDAGFTPNSNWDIPANASFDEDCPTILSVNDFGLNTISIYPNPTTSDLHIKINSNLKAVTIYSVLGKEVLSTSNKSIDVSRLLNGVYLIRIKDENGGVTTKRFIKQ
ncbi:T9SS type A sorting domain-containing protein [Lacinutrix cladophorae]